MGDHWTSISEERLFCSQSHREASFPKTTVIPQSCIYFGFTPGFFFNLLWTDRLLLKLKLLYIIGLLFLRWFFNKQNSLCADFSGGRSEGSCPFGRCPSSICQDSCIVMLLSQVALTWGKGWESIRFFTGWIFSCMKHQDSVWKTEPQASCVLSVNSLELHLKWIACTVGIKIAPASQGWGGLTWTCN